jgi:hypothetical protein
MALITRFEKESKERHSRHGGVQARYSVFSIDGLSYLQLETFGSEGRKIPGQVSQSIQLDRSAAGQLLNIILEAFPDISLDQTV